MSKKYANITQASEHRPLDGHSFLHQNPLIVELTKDTLCNVRDNLYTLKVNTRISDSTWSEHALEGY